jgi:hypothetical protein
MSSETPPATNRLNGLDAVGDEPPIIGMVTKAVAGGSVEPSEGEILTRDDSLLAGIPIRSALCEVLDEWDERLRRGEQRHILRLETSHVSRDTGGLYDLNEFERALQAEIDHIAWICLRPLQDLRYDEVIQPVGRVRRPARGAAQQLSAHSEQWERWAPDFPIPREVLASIRDDDTDLYENRVTRTLVTGALTHLNRRLLQLRSHLTKNVQGRHVLLSGWHWRQERLRASFDAQDVDTLIEMLELAMADLEAMAIRLAALDRSPLFDGTAARARVRSLRITNVLRRDPRYRRVPPLWTLWSSVQEDEASSRKRLDDPMLSQRGMDVLAEVLVAKALAWLGFTFDSLTGTYRRGPTSITLTSSDGATLLGIDGVVDSRDVRIVGLASPLRSGDQPDPLRAAQLLDSWLGEHHDGETHLAVLHPVHVDDVVSVAPTERTLIDHTGLDAVDASRTWSVIPATPLLVDSLERVTRVLRWHLTAPLYLANVVRLSCGDIDRNDREALNTLKTCLLDGRELLVTAPLPESDRQLLMGMESRRPTTWLSDIERVDALYDALLQCPIYPTHRSAHTRFERRDNGTFVCACRSCQAKWGTDICGACGSGIPFIRPGKAVPDGELPSDFFGGDLLASLCEGAAAKDVQPVDGGPDLRVLICPTCRKCSKASRFTNCGRCSGRAGSTL